MCQGKNVINVFWRCLKLVGLESSAFDLYQKYSGGMKRKLSLARTLLADPPVILLDEPTTGLDVLSSRNIREFVKKTVQESGKTVLYTTHYIEEAAQICDRIGILNQGKIVALDTPDALRYKIKKEQELICLIVEGITQTQIDQIGSLQGVISLNEKIDQDLMPNQKGLCLELKNVEVLPSIFDFLFEHKIRLVNFTREEPTLEEAFIELTKRT